MDLWLLFHLDGRAQILGMVWLALGVAYLAYLTRFFRLPPPELELTEDKRPAEPLPAE